MAMVCLLDVGSRCCCSTVVLIGVTCPATTVGTVILVILRAIDRVREQVRGHLACLVLDRPNPRPRFFVPKTLFGGFHKVSRTAPLRFLKGQGSGCAMSPWPWLLPLLLLASGGAPRATAQALTNVARGKPVLAISELGADCRAVSIDCIKPFSPPATKPSSRMPTAKIRPYLANAGS